MGVKALLQSDIFELPEDPPEPDPYDPVDTGGHSPPVHVKDLPDSEKMSIKDCSEKVKYYPKVKP